jgi:hypothetical protein
LFKEKRTPFKLGGICLTKMYKKEKLTTKRVKNIP